MPKEFKLPDLGEGIHEAQIVRVLVKAGDIVGEDQPLMEVETDKAAVEIPSPYAGKIEAIHAQEGQTVHVGDVIVVYGGEAVGAAAAGSARASTLAGSPARVSASAAPSVAAPPAAPAAPPGAPAAAAKGQDSGFGAALRSSGNGEGAGSGRTRKPAAPVVRKLAREMGIALDEVPGTGPGGRVTREDLERHAAQGRGAAESAPPAATRDGAIAGDGRAAAVVAAPTTRVAPMPAQPPPGEPGKDAWGPIRTSPLSQIRKTIAKQMVKSVFTIPHVTHMDEVETTKLEAHRKKVNEVTGGRPKATLMAYVIKALSIALRKFPIFNSSFDDEKGAIIYKEYINIGIAVDTERGLVVPVIRDADRLSLIGAAMALSAIAEKARKNQFTIEDLRGGTFTITNVGALGGTFATPVINHPEVAIFGMGQSRKRPIVDENGAIRPALMTPVFLSFDHRATDGAMAARFTSEVMTYLEDPGLMLLY